MTVDEQNFRAEQTRRRVYSRCKGLLEVPNYQRDGSYARVQFIHRTVKDFLEENRALYFFTSNTQKFNSHVTLCASYLLHADAIDPQHKDSKSMECFSDLLEGFLMQCHWLEKAHSPEYVPFLAAMDQFAKIIPFWAAPSFSINRDTETCLPHWTKRVDFYVRSCCEVNSLLDYAKIRSLNSYIQATANGGLRVAISISHERRLMRLMGID
ncbi:hypothetical protein F4777DRAFT_70004 [Nemania sp. FL0916]|nr:hypothetical protein F4777DRAFT_70004 [Nemania sp. FL0916]